MAAGYDNETLLGLLRQLFPNVDLLPGILALLEEIKNPDCTNRAGKLRILIKCKFQVEEVFLMLVWGSPPRNLDYRLITLLLLNCLTLKELDHIYSRNNFYRRLKSRSFIVKLLAMIDAKFQLGIAEFEEFCDPVSLATFLSLIYTGIPEPVLPYRQFKMRLPSRQPIEEFYVFVGESSIPVQVIPFSSSDQSHEILKYTLNRLQKYGSVPSPLPAAVKIHLSDRHIVYGYIDGDEYRLFEQEFKPTRTLSPISFATLDQFRYEPIVDSDIYLQLQSATIERRSIAEFTTFGTSLSSVSETPDQFKLRLINLISTAVSVEDLREKLIHALHNDDDPLTSTK